MKLTKHDDRRCKLLTKDEPTTTSIRSNLEPYSRKSTTERPSMRCRLNFHVEFGQYRVGRSGQRILDRRRSCSRFRRNPGTRRRGSRRGRGCSTSDEMAASRTHRQSPPPADTLALCPNPMLVTPRAKNHIQK